jgi:3-oxoacyl-[acyl-carrier protein] reductase
MQIEGKTIVVTGASGGIGAAVVELLVGKGANVVGQYTKSHKYVEKENYIAADFSNKEGVDLFISQVVQRFPRLDGIVFAHGIEGDVSTDPLNTDLWQKMMQTNFYAIVQIINGLRPNLVTGASIAAISSIMGDVNIAVPLEMVCYATIKATLTKLMITLAHDFSPNIRVNAISPGYTTTPMWQPYPQEMIEACAKEPLIKRFLTPQEVAHSVLYVLENDGVTGQNIVIDGGLGTKLVE